MVDPTKQLLLRWQSLADDVGLRRAAVVARILWVVALVLCASVVYGVMTHANEIFVAVAAAGLGWVVAERNALRTRLNQWPVFKTYIDWNRVQSDLNAGV